MTMVHSCNLDRLHYIYWMCVSYQSYVRKIEITVDNQQKGPRLYYEVLTQNINKPNCCDKWEVKLNKYTNWCITFEKMQQIQEIKQI